jgi:hypothetical protein
VDEWGLWRWKVLGGVMHGIKLISYNSLPEMFQQSHPDCRPRLRAHPLPHLRLQPQPPLTLTKFWSSPVTTGLPVAAARQCTAVGAPLLEFSASLATSEGALALR